MDMGSTRKPHLLRDDFVDQMKLLVLWIFFSQPWAIGPIPMTPGWFSTEYVYTTMEKCRLGAETFLPPHIISIDWACVKVGEDPPGDMAHIIRR